MDRYVLLYLIFFLQGNDFLKMLVCELFIGDLFLNTWFLSIKNSTWFAFEFKNHIYPFHSYLIQPWDENENHVYEANTNRFLNHFVF